MEYILVAGMYISITFFKTSLIPPLFSFISLSNSPYSCPHLPKHSVSMYV